jgi:CelD/BcsL family acetyltransferase involved in cellulose biosynthesis
MEGIRVRVGEAVRVGLRVGTVGWVGVAGIVAVLTRAGDVSVGVSVDNSPSARVQATSRKSGSKRDRRKRRWNEGMGELPV